MNPFNNAVSGVIGAKTYMPIKEQVTADIPIGKVIPLYADFCLPGDIWHLYQNIFIRTQPMLAPLLTELKAKVRAWFVPLRLCDDNTELIITGSKNGKFDKDVVIPSFASMFADATNYAVDKYSILDYMLSMPVGNYANISSEDGMPAQYWLKAVARIWFDWYRDENLSEYDDFDDFWDTWKTNPGKITPFFANWKKDYFTSALPFQQKGIRPSFDFSAVNPLTGDSVFPLVNIEGATSDAVWVGDVNPDSAPTVQFSNSSQIPFSNQSHVTDWYPGQNAKLNDVAAKASKQLLGADLTTVGTSFTTSDLRLMTQLQRVMERLARCGSRYTEYLQSNFGTSPADETLQRAQYLGGYSQPIITQEVLQTGPGSDNPVGTLRGKGISLSNNKMPSFFCKEFGVVIVTVEVMPKANYTQGIRRKYTYKNRFDFFNPSFQNLSEQEIRNSELFIDFSEDEDHTNDKTFGFTEMYNELRSGQDRLAGDMRGTMSYWTLARYFSDRPVLSESFVQARDEFKGPFAIQDKPPLIIEMGNINGVYRPMQKYGTPGYADHN